MNDLVDIEDRLRLAYQAVAQRTVVDDEVDLRDSNGAGIARALTTVGDGRSDAPHQPRWRRPGTLQLAAAVVVVVTGVTAAVVNLSSDDTAETPTFSTGETDMDVIPEAPIAGRFAHTAVWTGDEMVVFGGEGDDDETSDSPASGAAAYDPATKTWREIAEPPIPVSGWSKAVWTGSEIVVVPYLYSNGGQASTDVPTAASYDPDEDKWTVLDGPGACWVNQDCWVAWTGDRVLVAGLSRPAGVDGWYDDDLVATYDPATGTWDDLPTAPVNLDSMGGATWTGSELVYVGPDVPAGVETWDTDREVVAADRLAAVALDPVARTWRTLPAPDLPIRLHPLVAWTGTEVAVIGGEQQTEDGGIEYSDGATLDPATGTWTALPDPPARPLTSVVVVSGQLVVTATDDPEGRSLILDPVARTWSFGEADPRSDAQSDTAVAADDQVLIWGGTKVDGGVLDDGFTFTVLPTS